MQQPATFRVVIRLTQNEMSALSEKARMDCRQAREQARFLLLTGLGIIPAKPSDPAPPPPPDPAPDWLSSLGKG